MISVATWFFLCCGVYQIGTAFVLHAQLPVPRFMVGRNAFSQLCQGVAAMFVAQACATTEANAVTWVAAVLAPPLMYVGSRADRGERAKRVHAPPDTRAQRTALRPDR